MFCENCGFQHELGSQFCSNCGVAKAEPYSPSPTVKKKSKIWIPVVITSAVLVLASLLGMLFFIGVLGSEPYTCGLGHITVVETDDLEIDDDETITDYYDTNDYYTNDYTPYDYLLDDDDGIENWFDELNPHVLAMMAFAELAREIDNDGPVTLERAAEIFGVDFEVVDGDIAFYPAPDLQILAFPYWRDANMIANISLRQFPPFMNDRSLYFDEAVIRGYEGNWGNLDITLEYFESLLGRRGMNNGYSHGWFDYMWLSNGDSIRARADNQGNILSVSLHIRRENYELIALEDMTPTEKNEILEKIYILVHELVESEGVLCRERIIEIIGANYLESEYMTVANMRFQLARDVHFAINGEGNRVLSTSLHANPSMFFIEDLVIDRRAIAPYVGVWLRSDRGIPTLDYIENILGVPGIVSGYRFENSIEYTWVSHDTFVQAKVGEDGKIEFLMMRDLDS